MTHTHARLIQVACTGKGVPGREGWVTFALPLPTGTIERVLKSYDLWNSTVQTLVLAFVVEVQDPARTDGGTIKDAKLVSKMIVPADVHALCEAESDSLLQADSYSQSMVLGMMPHHATTHDAVGRFPPLSPVFSSNVMGSVFGVTTLLLLGSSSVFNKPARRHESIDVENIFGIYFTSNIKRLKVGQMLADGSVFRVPVGGAMETEGDVQPTEALLRLCPWSNTSEVPATAASTQQQRVRGCVSHYLARARVLDFVSNSVYRIESLYAPLEVDGGAAALGSWAHASELTTGDMTPARIAMLYNHSRSVGARYNVNSRFRQAYLMSATLPAGDGQSRVVAQHRVIASSACVHTAADRAVRTGAYMVVVPSVLPVGVGVFLDTPYWGRLYASAFRELLGLYAHEVYANVSSAVWAPATQVTLFNVHIVLPAARRDRAESLVVALNTGLLRWRVLTLVRNEFARYSINVSSVASAVAFVTAHTPDTHTTSPSCAARVVAQTFTDVNNADTIALMYSEQNSSLPSQGLARMLQTTVALGVDEFCSASGEEEVLALLKARFSAAFIIASEGSVRAIEPTGVVIMSDAECNSDPQMRRLLQATSTVVVLAEVLLFPTSTARQIEITTTEELRLLGMSRVLIEPTSIVNTTILTAGADWIRDGMYYIPPTPVVPQTAIQTPSVNTTRANDTAPVDVGALEAAQTLFRMINVLCMVLFVMHTLTIVLVFGIEQPLCTWNQRRYM